MQVYLENILQFNDTVAVALSGGCDSMCLLHYLCKHASRIGYSVIALNVEHGIRGENSIKDTEFVKDYCAKNDVLLLTYSVDAISYAKENKLSIEQSARALRYKCFEEALNAKKCNKIATAHHRDDNAETVLFNLFRGTGLKGLTGINRERKDNIIRPFLSVDRAELEEYAKENDVPFVTDETNLTDDYTRNFIRHNIIPKIKEIFPELNSSVERLSQIATADDDYINGEVEKLVSVNGEAVNVPIPCHPALFSRAIIVALKAMGIKKDWEKAHIDQVIELASLANGARLSLPKGITAIKEYDKIVFYKPSQKLESQLKFKLGRLIFQDKTLILKREANSVDLKGGLYLDLDKLPNTAIIRTRKEGDLFTKFGGGTKLLNDYLTDKKIPLRERDQIAVIADGKEILAIFGLAISDKVKVDTNTKSIISINLL